jgi:hypothetical protein
MPGEAALKYPGIYDFGVTPFVAFAQQDRTPSLERQFQSPDGANSRCEWLAHAICWRPC